MSIWARRVRVLGISVAISLILATGASAVVVFNVDSTLDQIDDDVFDGVCNTAANTCTLRAAVMQANLNTAGTRIVLPAGTYLLSLPAAGADGADSGDLNLTTPTSGSDPQVSITGAGQSVTFIESSQLQQSRIFMIDSGRAVLLEGLNLRHGNVSAGQIGGGIRNAGALTMHHCTVSDNTAEGGGGGIHNDGTLYVFDSKISKNIAGGFGGGISNRGSAFVWRTTIVDNVARFAGGGIANFSMLDANQSTISMNTAHTAGGGIFNSVALTLINTTVYGNSADLHGGGAYSGRFFSDPNANIFNSTIAFNDADADADPNGGNGGGVYVDPGTGLHIRNTLVVGNYIRNAPIYEDCWGTVNSYGRNLFWEPGDGCFIVIQTGSAWYLNSLDALGPLQINGGRTATIALLPGSNAIDGGDPALGCIGPSLQPLASDQRGAARAVGARCDLGAFEVGALPVGFLFTDGFESGNLWEWGW